MQELYQTWPQAVIRGRLPYLTAPLLDPVASMATTTSIDSLSATSPKTTWRPLSQEVSTVVMTNCEPFLMLKGTYQFRASFWAFRHSDQICTGRGALYV